MTKSSIEWTEHTWNPVRGCSRVSPGCDNCYAMRQAHRSHGPGGAYEGLTTIRRGKVDWTGVARFIPDQLAAPLRRRKPTTYFVNSMSDLFHESLTNEEIAAVFGVMAACPQHTFQVLTKRAKRMHDWFEWIRRCPVSLGGPTVNAARGVKWFAWNRIDAIEVFDPKLPWVWPLPNVWLGVSAENQEQLDKRVPLLLQCPAAVRWVSAEPLLGPLDLGRAFPCGYYCDERVGHVDHPFASQVRSPLDWVVVGSESGYGARPMHIEWIASVRDQCAAADVPFFAKQIANDRDKKGGNPEYWPTGTWPREYPKQEAP